MFSYNDSLNWDVELIKKSFSTGLQHCVHIFKEVFKEFEPIETETPQTIYIDFKHNNYKYRLHLEDLVVPLRGQDCKNWFVINQELVNEVDLSNFKYLDLVLCKTKYAYNLLLDLKKRNYDHKYNIYYTGFTSISKNLIGVEPCYNRFLHVAGISPFKNTRMIFETWCNNPHWPILTIIGHGCFFHENLPYFIQPNIRIIPRVILQSELKLHMNTTGIHIAASKAEGFGHYINEGRSVSALIIYTNHLPINEFFFSNQSAVPIEVSRLKDIGKLPGSKKAIITSKNLEGAVNNVLEMSLELRKKKGKLAYNAFIHDRIKFLDRITKLKSRFIINT